jgi:hypothetical protein
MERPKLGEWCIIKNRAVKRRRDVKSVDRFVRQNNHYVTWVKWSWTPPEIKGMFIGYRMKREGSYWTEGWGEDYTQHFECDKSIEVWLFVTDGRSKPIEVFPEDVGK